MAHVETSAAHPRASRAIKLIALAAIGVLASFVGVKGYGLYREWRSLQSEETLAKQNAVIGYVNIHPRPNFAQKPKNWFHHEGDSTFLWSRWHIDKHEWFEVAKGDFTVDQITYPLGRDVVQAIDYPVIEFSGGTLWEKIPDAAPVVGIELNGIQAVYPMRVLEKVLVINDLIEETAVLLTLQPSDAEVPSVSAFEATIDGRRVTMGVSGYSLVGPSPFKALLYDRGTLSLWVEDESSLRAVAGARKGAVLRRIGALTPKPWADWRSRYPKSRLIVGADRSRGLPNL